ncbi:START domain containing 14 [Salarias fasciatus]|uniref:START domain-containing protein 10 n=1 Tax=Salarias fasciatus TaxID=181472 RepID=A0A672IBS7_SALFA|nr:START domain-containing protein 10-like [Salarias fasciatus]
MSQDFRLEKILLDLICEQLPYNRVSGGRKLHTRSEMSQQQRASIVPTDADFDDFKKQCLSTENWVTKYNKNGKQVLVEVNPAKKKSQHPKIHKIKCILSIDDVSAATMYDVLHDGEYRKTWDSAMNESFDIASLSDNADVGYYSWRCPPPIKNRDVVTLRTWRVKDNEYIIFNFSVKHPEHPPTKANVRAISILTGYYIQPTGPNSCQFTYLSQADPMGSLPKWVINKASQVLAPQVMTHVHTAGKGYQEWKLQNSPGYKPWLYPEQNRLPAMDPAKLSLQRADELEHVDESSKVDAQECKDSR